jgi:tRNA N6-adenosine threonylcarbamoyltransferase
MIRSAYPDARVLVVAGGVASNACVRSALSRAAEDAGFEMVAPPVPLCSDNAVMVAWAGIERLRLGWTDGLNADARPRWKLEDLRETSSSP